MRLTIEQKQGIQSIVHSHLGVHAAVSVFGSRVDDDKRGGDVDLFIETRHHVPLLQRARLKMALEQALALPVDLLFHTTNEPLSAFQSLAAARAQPLESTRP